VDFTFTQDQRDFRGAMCGFLMNELTPELLRETWQTQGGRSAELWGKIGAQGVLGLSVPEEFGGLELGDVDWVRIIHDLGYFGTPDTVIDTAYVAAGLLNGLPPDSKLKQEWLPRVAAGNARIAIGHPVNPWVVNAQSADLLLLHHREEVHAIKPDSATLERHGSIDPSRQLYDVQWTPTAGSRIASAEAGRDLWADALDRGSLAAATQLLGLAKRMLDLSVDYTSQRKQFGKPIGSFQAVKHLLANVAVKIEFAGPVAFRAAYSLQHRDPLRGVHVSHAKLAASDTAALAARNGMQVHGAMGYTWEVDLQIFMKRTWALLGAWGDLAFHKTRVADFILRDDAPLGPGNTFNPTH
jgi:alkylation response protein AidB-like acyl-CoA dehydrogenase